MAGDGEFRIGDRQRDFAVRGLPKPVPEPGLDPTTFPTLHAFLKADATEFRGRIDALSARARLESSPDLQRALQTAARVLPEIYKKYGG